MKQVRHSITMSFLSALLTAVLLAGCTTPTGPSTTSTAPTQSTTTSPASPPVSPSPSITPSPDRETAIKQAETAFRTVDRDLNELMKKGGATSTPPNIAAKIAGPYQETTERTIMYFHSEQLTFSGEITLKTFTLASKTKPWPTTELIFDLCTDASRSTLVQGPNKNFVRQGGIARYQVTMRYLDSTWKVWDQTAGTKVKSC